MLLCRSLPYFAFLLSSLDWLSFEICLSKFSYWALGKQKPRKHLLHLHGAMNSVTSG